MQPKSGLERDVALGDNNGLAEVRPMSRGREAVTARPAQPVAREQVNRARHAYPPPLLQPNCAGGVLTEQRALADVPAKHRCALAARLLGDDAFGHPDSSSCGRKIEPKRVTGHLSGIKPDTGAVALSTSATD